jgi:lauroyl/myristoyl acyltransferase
MKPTAPAEDRAALPPTSRLGLLIFFFLARRMPWLLKIIKPLATRLAVQFSADIREGTTANARRLIAGATEKQITAFTSNVVGNFYDFVVDIARSGAMSIEQLHKQIETIEGREEYLAHRRAGGGAIIVTAHMGSFEVGLVALAEVESKIHVVFKRDQMDSFETIRKSLRKNLGVLEAPIDEGWETWIALRDTLQDNHVVVVQADRAMPGQKARAVPMFGAHILLPLGPLKLAQISGSPIIPVFTIRNPDGRCRLIAESPIRVDADAQLINGVHPALLQLAAAIEKHVAAHPEQWLILTPAFVEDQHERK